MKLFPDKPSPLFKDKDLSFAKPAAWLFYYCLLHQQIMKRATLCSACVCSLTLYNSHYTTHSWKTWHISHFSHHFGKKYHIHYLSVTDVCLLFGFQHTFSANHWAHLLICIFYLIQFYFGENETKWWHGTCYLVDIILASCCLIQR